MKNKIFINKCGDQYNLILLSRTRFFKILNRGTRVSSQCFQTLITYFLTPIVTLSIHNPFIVYCDFLRSHPNHKSNSSKIFVLLCFCLQETGLNSHLNMKIRKKLQNLSWNLQQKEVE